MPTMLTNQQRLWDSLMAIARIGAKLSFEAADGGGGTRTRIVFEKTGLAPMDNA